MEYYSRNMLVDMRDVASGIPEMVVGSAAPESVMDASLPVMIETK